MTKYRKKPVVIEAIQFKSNNAKEINKFITQEKIHGYDTNGDLIELVIPTLEGNMKADLGDYIIKGVQGEFYPCKPDIFEKTYEKVEE